MSGHGLRPAETEMNRVLTPLDAWALALGCTVGWGSFVLPGTTFLPAAGPLGTTIAFVIGTFAMLAVAFNYGYMARRYPGDGGIYHYTRQVFGPNHAFVCSWCLVLAYATAMVSNATALALVVRGTIGTVLQVGPHYVIAGYQVYLGEAVSGVVITVLAALLLMRSGKATGVVETLLALGMTVGTIAIIAMLVASPKVTLASLEPLYSPHKSPLAGVLVVLASVPWAYIGFEAVMQVTGECRFSIEKFTRIMVVAILCGTVMYLAYNTAAAALAPQRYQDWSAYVDDLGNLKGLQSIPTFYAGHRLGGTPGLTVFFLTAVCATFTGVVGFYVAVTRLMHAMAVDRALPRRFAQLHPRYRTPAEATMVVLVLTLFVPFLGRNVLGWIHDIMSLGALVAYGYVSVAVYLQARRDGTLLARVTGAVGVLVSVICILLLIVPFPGLDVSLSKETYVVLFAWVALGVNFYTPTIER